MRFIVLVLGQLTKDTSFNGAFLLRIIFAELKGVRKACDVPCFMNPVLTLTVGWSLSHTQFHPDALTGTEKFHAIFKRTILWGGGRVIHLPIVPPDHSAMTSLAAIMNCNIDVK